LRQKNLVIIILILIFSVYIKAADSHVRINSIGFVPNGVKGFTCAQSATTFEVRNASNGTVVFNGNLGSAINATDSGETVYKGDFSSFTTPGTYYVNVPGVGRSVNFTIADDVYNNPFIVAMRAMYLWRCGTAVSLTYNGDTFSHAACHMNDAYLDYVGGGHNIRDGKGGWHDAGDYNKYIVNAGITVGMMFMAWEHFPAIRNISWGLPDTATGYPDFLKEMKWEIDWVLKMAYSDGSGRVSGKLSALNFCAFIMPEAETAARYFTDWGSAATADYVAMLAMAARIFRPYDQAYADTCINAAWVSYNFLLANTANKNPDYSAFSTGGYGTTDTDDRLWAAAEMWATTGSTTAHQDFTTRANAYSDKTDADFDWGNVKNLGMYTYLLCTRTGKVAAIYDDIRNDLLADANNLLTYRNNHGYARMLGTNGTNYYWGCNGSVARQAMLLQIANMVSPNQEYVNACLDILGYLFGRNMHRRSYVTGLGTNPPMYPHDRRSGADGITNPWPGYLVGGSNGTNSGDPVLSAMQAGLPPAQYWVDNQDSYASNEIAINWQGALIYALAGFYYVTGTPTYTPTQTRTGTRTPTFSYTRTPTFTFSPTASVSPTRTRTPTFSYTNTATRTWTQTNTPAITSTYTGTATRTNSPSVSASPTSTRTLTPSFTQTATSSQQPTMSRTPTYTRTATGTWTQTNTPAITSTYTGTATRTNSPSVSASPTSTRTLTPSFTQTATSSQQPTMSRTPTYTRTATGTWTQTNTPAITSTYTGTATRTNSPSVSDSPTSTRTLTPSFTQTATSSQQPTMSRTPTYTRTATGTWTGTNTPTYTRTVSPTFTITDTISSNTPTNTPTYTLTTTITVTRTNTSSPTATASSSNTQQPTSTFTNTRTLTPSFTQTATSSQQPTMSRTPTYTRTATGTWTGTNTPTYTRTVSPTFTITDTISSNTPTNTPTYTLTTTITVTRTNTSSPTATASSSNTQQPTSTFTNTRTLTPSFTQTATSSQQPTMSRTPTYTRTATGTWTGTNTPTYTQTVSPTFTITDTISSNTPTVTPTHTYTASFTRTLTYTMTHTLTHTLTSTGTFTYTQTLTLTLTQTITRTNTPTLTLTPSYTLTILPTQTYTLIPTATPTKIENQKLLIENIVLYPSPYNPEKGNLTISFDITQNVKTIKVKIYTTSYRKIKQLNYSYQNAGNIKLTIENKYLQNIANGVYHILIGIVNLKNEEAWSKPEELIILR